MKKLIAIVVSMFILFILYYDMSKGTLPVSKAETVTSFTNKADYVEEIPKIQYKTVKIKAGDTVLSIVEELANGSIPVPIQTIVDDFETLNKGVKTHHIQIDKTYKFPIY
ncbi:hypothetical protein LCL95_12055 [Bacillus timonensis]|nr:hypothetical protein [Bacillus timonensis]